MEVKLRTVERTVALIYDIVRPMLVDCVGKRFCGFVPFLFVPIWSSGMVESSMVYGSLKEIINLVKELCDILTTSSRIWSGARSI